MKSQAVLELHVAELRQLFNAMDPAPFRDWWPIRSEARLLDRLGEIDVRLLDARPQARTA